MFNTILSSSTVSIKEVIMVILISIIIGILITTIYLITNKFKYSNSFILSLLFMPALISTIIVLIGNNIAGAFSLAGVFSIIRFRSAPGSAKDIIFILFCVGSGLAIGVSEYLVAIIFTIILGLVFIITSKIPLFHDSASTLTLKIIVPEDLNNEDVFEEILVGYTSEYELQKISTKDLGSVFELVYKIKLIKQEHKKELLDKLRCRNGNLNISLSKTIDNFEL